MRRSLLVAALVILVSFVASLALSVWITWSYVLPDLRGANSYLAPGLKFPIGAIERALAATPTRDPTALAGALGVTVTPLDGAARAAYFADPPLSVPLARGETFHLHGADESARAVLTFGDGRAYALGPLEGMTPFQPATLTLWITFVVVASLGASAAIFIPLARRLRRVEVTARRLSAGDLAARAPTSGATRELALALNIMAERTEGLIRSHEELLQAVSHELRTPAARIRFQLELLESAHDEATRRKRCDAIDRDLAEFDDLVGELLSFLRLGIASGERARAVLDVAAALDGIAAEASEAPHAATVHVEPGPAADVVADPRAFRRALGNLVANAQRAARGRVALSWRASADTLVVAVDDDGPGVPPADRARIFAPFVVGDASRSRATGGVGLGLAIVRRIVELHGGTVTVGDGPLGGARFETTWPRAGRPSPL